MELSFDSNYEFDRCIFNQTEKIKLPPCGWRFVNCSFYSTETGITVRPNPGYFEREFSKVLLKYNCIDAADQVSILNDLLECCEEDK